MFRAGPLSEQEFHEIYARVPRLTVEVVVADERGILLTRRDIDPCRGFWHLPGGTVHFGEHLLVSVRRVAKQELGIQVIDAEAAGFLEYPSHFERGLDHPVGLAFRVTRYDGDLRVGPDASQYGWFRELPGPMHGEQIRFLEKLGLAFQPVLASSAGSARRRGATIPDAPRREVGSDLRGRGVVVTGGGRGIGRAIAGRMAAKGARVVINDIDAAAAAEVAAAVSGYAVAGDAATEVGAEALIRAARERLGRIDVYVANAGVAPGGGLATTEGDWAAALEVNLMAHVRAARELIPTWVDSGGGRLVVTASAAGLLTLLGDPAYAASKHAAVAFAEWLSATYSHRGVVVQVLCPQGVNTRMLDAATPVGRVVAHDGVLEPEQVADAVLQAMGDDRFLILPHPSVLNYYQHRAMRTDRWLQEMNQIQRRLEEAVSGTTGPLT